jgi:hypothetical protein
MMTEGGDLADLWPLLQEIYGLLWPARRSQSVARAPLREIVAEFGVRPDHLGHFMYVLENYDPQALSAGHYMARNCYDEPQSAAAPLVQWAEDGLLDEIGGGEFRLNDKGQRFYRRIREALAPGWAFSTVPAADLDRLLALLRQVAEATAAAPEPPPHWATTTRRRFGLSYPAQSPLEQLHDLVFDLWAYRDDAHLAAWRTRHDIPPRSWEALTFVWRGEAVSAEELVERLRQDGRGFTVADYAASLAELSERGWIEPGGGPGEFRPTAEGRRLRDEAEQQTDTLFYQPWRCLSEEEAGELRASLFRLRDTLKELAAQPAAAG